MEESESEGRPLVLTAPLTGAGILAATFECLESASQEFRINGVLVFSLTEF